MFEWLLIHLVTLPTTIINGTQPCFLNYTAGIDIWQNCGMGTDYLKAVLGPWIWVTGGYFGMILIGLFVMISWLKYQKIVYPIMIGTLYFPYAYYFFPAQWITDAILGIGVVYGLLLVYIFVSQTNES